MQPIHLLVVALRTALSAVVVVFYVIHLLHPRKVEPLTGASRLLESNPYDDFVVMFRVVVSRYMKFL